MRFRSFAASCRVVSSFILHPVRSFRLLGRLPDVLRGMEYARQWRPREGEAGAPPSPPSNPLRSYFDAHREGKGIWKWLHYFEIYHRHFGKFVGRDVTILEIGIFSGGSLEMWRSYFGPKCRVYGIDIEEVCRAHRNEYTEIFIGDQSSREFWKSFKEKVPAVDIVVDDGGHQTEQQIVTLEELLPHLAPGGVYLCEDIHSPHNGFTAYAHGLVKSLNDRVRGDGPGATPTPYQRWVNSIHFYPYVMVIEKAATPRQQFLAPRQGTQWEPFLGGGGGTPSA